MIRIFPTQAEAAAAVQQIETELGIPYQLEHPDGGWYIGEPSQNVGLSTGTIAAPVSIPELKD